jgi:Amt family ammonium transporter
MDTAVSQSLTVYEDPVDLNNEGAWLLPATPMPSAYLPILGLLGSGLMLVGWFGLATGVHAPTALNFTPAQAAVNGLLAALAAALTAAGYSWFTTRELNPLMTARGLVAGLVVAMAGAPFGPVWLFVVAGLLMGLLVPLLIYFFNQVLRLADELGVLTTYGVSAMISLLLVAVFADGRAGQGWNGLGSTEYLGVPGQGVAGLMVAPGFVADWPGQLQAQALGMGIILIWALLLSFLLFQTVIAVTDAWARTGLELAGPFTSTRPDTEKPAEFTDRL